MRTILAAVLATAMTVSSAFADDAAPAPATGPLAPGKPAGVKQADIEAGGVVLVLGILAGAAAIALIASSTQGSGSSSSTGTH